MLTVIILSAVLFEIFIHIGEFFHLSSYERKQKDFLHGVFMMQL